jgi:hypothetical protein
VRHGAVVPGFEDFRLWSMLHDAHRRAGGPDVRRASGAVAPSWSAEHGRALMSPPVVTVSPRASRRLQHVRRARARCATDGRALGAPGGCGDLISGPPRFVSGMRSAARREVSHHHLPLQPGVLDQLRLQSDETRRRKSSSGWNALKVFAEWVGETWGLCALQREVSPSHHCPTDNGREG